MEPNISSHPPSPQKKPPVFLPTQSFRRYAKTIEPLIKKPQNRVYTTTILSFLVVSLFLWYAIRPTVRTILSLRREIADSLKISKSMEEKISMLVQAQGAYQKEMDRLSLVSQAVPETSTPVSALTTIRDLARQSGATVSGIQLTAAKLTNPQATSAASLAAAKAEKTSFSITIDGQYENIKTFLDTVVNLRRIMTINSIIVEPVKKNQSDSAAVNPQLRLAVELTIYHLPGGSQ